MPAGGAGGRQARAANGIATTIVSARRITHRSWAPSRWELILARPSVVMTSGRSVVNHGSYGGQWAGRDIPSGSRVLALPIAAASCSSEMVALRRSAPLRSAPVRMAPVRSAPRKALMRWALVRSAALGSAQLRLTLLTWAPVGRPR